MLWIPTYHKRLAQLADGLTTAASFVIAYFVWNWIRINFGIGLPILLSWDLLWKILGLSIIWVIILDRLKDYTYQRFTSLHREFSKVFKATIIGVFVFFASFFIFRFQYVPRTYIFIFTIINFVCLAFEKLVLFKTTKIIREKGRNRKKILVVGTGNEAITFVKTVEKNMGWGLDIIGFLSNKNEERGQTLFAKKILGSFSDVTEVLHEKIIDEGIISV